MLFCKCKVLGKKSENNYFSAEIKIEKGCKISLRKIRQIKRNLFFTRFIQIKQFIDGMKDYNSFTVFIFYLLENLNGSYVKNKISLLRATFV